MSGQIERTGNLRTNAEYFSLLNADTTSSNDSLDGASLESLLALVGDGNPNAVYERMLVDTGSLVKARLLRQNDGTTADETRQVRQTQEINASSSPEELARDPRVRAMLDVLGFTEGTGDNYGRVVYGTVLRAPYNPDLVGRRNVTVTDFSRHPNILVRVRPGLNSTAAGRYQFLKGTWDGLGMRDFSPRSQDIAAVKLMQRRGMIEPLLRGDIRTAVFRGAPEWASLPTARGGSYYGGQPARTIREIETRYNASLERYQNGSTPTTPRQPTVVNGLPATTLERGDRGAGVRQLQDALVRLGHLTAAQVNTGPGIYGPRTEAAVKEFQRANDLTPTGDYDRATREALSAITGGVERGSRGNVVRAMQTRLVELGYMSAAQVSTGPGVFGARTEAALKKFQAEHNIEQTGKLDPKTYAALQKAANAAPIQGDAPVYSPYTVYGSGSGGVRRVSGYNQLLPHHDYQTVRRGGQTLEVRDVVLTRPGQPNAGQAVPSPLAGRVVAAGRRGGYGNAVEVVNDRTGQRFLIGHLKSIDVRVGQQIGYGQTIGQQGSTGHSTGPHVHIESQPSVISRWVGDLMDGRFDGV